MGHIGKVEVGLVWQKRDPLMQTDAWRKERSQKWHGGKKVSTPSGSGGNSYQVCLRDLNIFLVCMSGDRRLSQSERASLIQPQSYGSKWLSTCVALYSVAFFYLSFGLSFGVFHTDVMWITSLTVQEMIVLHSWVWQLLKSWTSTNSNLWSCAVLNWLDNLSRIVDRHH